MKKQKSTDGGSQFMEAFVEKVLENAGIVKQLERAEVVLDILQNGPQGMSFGQCADCGHWCILEGEDDVWICECPDCFHCGCEDDLKDECRYCGNDVCYFCSIEGGYCDECA